MFLIKVSNNRFFIYSSIFNWFWKVKTLFQTSCMQVYLGRAATFKTFAKPEKSVSTKAATFHPPAHDLWVVATGWQASSKSFLKGLHSKSVILVPKWIAFLLAIPFYMGLQIQSAILFAILIIMRTAQSTFCPGLGLTWAFHTRAQAGWAEDGQAQV